MTRPDGHDLADLTVDAQHRYWYRGVQYRGVTNLLKRGVWRPPFSGPPSEALAAAMARGTAVHAYASSVDAGRREPALITPETANYIAADATIRRLSGYEAIATEFNLVHPLLRYAGRLDLVLWYCTHRVLGDRKTGESYDPVVWLQLELYRRAWEFWRPTEPIDYTAVLLLKANTDPRVMRDPHPAFTRKVAEAALWKNQWHDVHGEVA